MSQSRLSRAAESGLLPLPEGRITLLRPPRDVDLAALPREQVTIVATFRPDVEFWTAQGLDVATEPPESDLAIVFANRSKSLSRAMVAEASARAATVAVDGQKTDGIDSLWRDIRARLGEAPSITAGHGRIAVAPGGDAFGDWASPGPERQDDGWVRQPGVFSEGGPDRGSETLAAALPAQLPARMADLGAGWGYLARAVLEREGVQSLDLIEAEKLSLDCARLNVADSRATFHWADATAYRPEQPFDGIVCNPPFHAGRAADPSLGRGFIAAAAAMLTPNGALWLVANRQLPYEAALEEAFVRTEEIGGTGGFKLLHATRPRRTRRA
ncbi:class I SAM-dependent methyltransferase [Wenxinia marina]|uniref:16S rRNA methyltransferase n=1 Tax=Wenxinia marina DSM 24838 TaxID=1123501 RepID=A0A0D0Q863_9RHOB|nr:methyltransferase [Wenxinia marina]KIQ70604.1 16S rRNA methyltransferase [Wenxinia marina DSM 24838]GGL51789.1 methyltransferase [Wenxinia marina]